MITSEIFFKLSRTFPLNALLNFLRLHLLDFVDIISKNVEILLYNSNSKMLMLKMVHFHC